MTQNDSQYWLWVIRPEYYDQVEPATSWSCHKDTRKGDLVLMWMAKKRHDISYLLQATSDSTPDPQWNYSCEYQVLYKFKNPINIKDLRIEDAFFKNWPAYSRNFQGSSFRIPSIFWNRLNHIALEKDPEYKYTIDNLKIQIEENVDEMKKIFAQ